VFCVRVRAKTVTRTIAKTLPPLHSLDFPVPRVEEPVALSEEEQQMEVFRQVEEAVADEGLMAFRELPLEEDLEVSFQEEQEPIEIFVPQAETIPEAGLVILGTPPVLPFEPEEEPEEEPEAIEPALAPEEAPQEVFAEAREVSPIPEPTPGPPAVPCPGKPYMVRRGDSYQLIAKRFGVSVRALLDVNPEQQPAGWWWGMCCASR